MKKNKILPLLLVAAILTGCSNSINPVLPAQKINQEAKVVSEKVDSSKTFLSKEEFSALEKEYSQFKTESFSAGYLQKKMDLWISKGSSGEAGMTREIEFARIKHDILLKDLVEAHPTIYRPVISGNGEVILKRSEHNFDDYIKILLGTTGLTPELQELIDQLRQLLEQESQLSEQMDLSEIIALNEAKLNILNEIEESGAFNPVKVQQFVQLSDEQREGLNERKDVFTNSENESVSSFNDLKAEKLALKAQKLSALSIQQSILNEGNAELSSAQAGKDAKVQQGNDWSEQYNTQKSARTSERVKIQQIENIVATKLETYSERIKNILIDEGPGYGSQVDCDGLDPVIQDLNQMLELLDQVDGGMQTSSFRIMQYADSSSVSQVRSLIQIMKDNVDNTISTCHSYSFTTSSFRIMSPTQDIASMLSNIRQDLVTQQSESDNLHSAQEQEVSEEVAVYDRRISAANEAISEANSEITQLSSQITVLTSQINEMQETRAVQHVLYLNNNNKLQQQIQSNDQQKDLIQSSGGGGGGGAS